PAGAAPRAEVCGGATSPRPAPAGACRRARGRRAPRSRPRAAPSPPTPSRPPMPASAAPPGPPHRDVSTSRRSRIAFALPLAVQAIALGVLAAAGDPKRRPLLTLALLGVGCAALVALVC